MPRASARRAVSIRDVAERAGVSVGTVSNVLNGSAAVGHETAERVRAAIAELGYVRNDAARQLRAGRSTTIGLLVLDIRNPFFTDLARGAQDEAARRGLRVLVADSDQDPDREAAYVDGFEQMRVRGLLVSPIGDVEPRLHALLARGVPSVLVDRASAGGRLPSVAVDDVAGGRLAVEHLVAGGARRIAFAGGPPSMRQVADRYAGARAGTRAAGIPLETIPVPSLTVAAGRAAGERLVHRAPGARPDAVFAANDLVALGLLQALVLGGIRVPGEMSVVGYDDIDFAASAVVPLTSVRQPSRQLGAAAVRLLEEAGDAPASSAQIVFRPEIVPRASTRAARLLA